MATGVVKVEGAARLRRTLRAAGLDLSDLKTANAAASKTAAGAARPFTPVRSGALLRSVRSSGTLTAGIIRAGRKSVPYAGAIHWGWPAHGITAQPFLTEGARASEPVWIKLYEADMADAINKVKGK